MAGVAYCMYLHQSAFSGVVCRDVMFCNYCMLCVSCIKAPLAVSGAWTAFCVTHAVCSCIEVPLAVSCGRLHGRCGVLYVLASKCL